MKRIAAIVLTAVLVFGAGYAVGFYMRPEPATVIREVREIVPTVEEATAKVEARQTRVRKEVATLRERKIKEYSEASGDARAACDALNALIDEFVSGEGVVSADR